MRELQSLNFIYYNRGLEFLLVVLNSYRRPRPTLALNVTRFSAGWLATLEVGGCVSLGYLTNLLLPKSSLESLIVLFLEIFLRAHLGSIALSHCLQPSLHHLYLEDYIKHNYVHLDLTYPEYVQWIAPQKYVDSIYLAQSSPWKHALNLQMVRDNLETSWLGILISDYSAEFLSRPLLDCIVSVPHMPARVKLLNYIVILGGDSEQEGCPKIWNACVEKEARKLLIWTSHQPRRKALGGRALSLLLPRLRYSRALWRYAALQEWLESDFYRGVLRTRRESA